MKDLFKKISVFFLALATVFGLVACGGKEPEHEHKFENCVCECGEKDPSDACKEPEHVHEFVEGVCACGEVDPDYVKVYPLAEGVYSYVAASYSDRTAILGILEKYAVNAGLTGITVFEDSGWALYNPLVEKGSESYIPNYGFGILTEGRATGELAGETNPAWKKYYHTYETEDPKNINYADDKGSVVGDLVGYIMGGYWGTEMNDTKDGYNWVGDLANEKPQPMNQSELTKLASKYKFEVKIGSQLKYNTLSTAFAKYAGREVKIEDYLTPWKLLHTKANGWARGAENLTTASGIKGMNAYYNGSGDGFNEALWENVGLKAYEENGKGYIEVEFNQPCSSFYAMYYIASSLYAPVPQEFIDEIGGPSVYGKFDLEKGYSPVDTTLSTGPYVLEEWEQGKQIVFKKNELSHNKTQYQGWDGVHINILAAAATDTEAALKEFLADKLTACGIPSTKLDEYKNDPRACQTVGATTTKLNVNTCTAEEWEYLFGENGIITQTAKEDYWVVEPALSNEQFVKGLSYAINRLEFATEKGRTPSVNYFGSAYMADPENGIGYNSTQAHKDAVADLLEGTDGYGYSVELARAAFKAAAEALLASGAYKEGDTIKLEIAWQTQTNVDVYHGAIKNYWETAFNHESVCGNKLTLEVVEYVPASWSDVYYKKMMVGQYDIGFGGVSGNALNPLNFFEVLKSDNSSGFTLNWGPNTNEVSQDLIWEGQAWSFDALWQAAETGGYFKDGLFQPSHAAELTEAVKNADGTATFTFKGNIVAAEGIKVEITDAVIFTYFAAENANGYAYDEDSCEYVYDAATDTITVTVSAELYAKYAAGLAGYPFGIDIYYNVDILEIPSSQYDSVSVELPA